MVMQHKAQNPEIFKVTEKQLKSDIGRSALK